MNIYFAVFIKVIMRGLQLINTAEKSFRKRRILKGEIGAQRIAVDFLAKGGVRQKRFDLRAEEKRAVAAFAIIMRLDAENIACAEEAAAGQIVKHKGEHAAQM